MLKKILIGLGVLAATALIIWAVAINSADRLNRVIKHQLSAIKQDQTDVAYQETAKDFQNITSKSDFNAFIEQYPIMKDYTKITFLKKQVNGDTAVVNVKLVADDGKAVPIEYHLTKENGQWKVMGLTVDPENITAENALTYSTQKTMIRGPVALTQAYDNKDSRYKINYPSGWEVDKSTPGTLVFSGKQGTPQYYSTINIQTILTKDSGGQFTNVKDFVNDLKKQAKVQSPDVHFIKEEPITIIEADGTKADGTALTFSYRYHGEEFKQWQIVILRSDKQVFYAYGYTSPFDAYSADEDIARGMLASWSIY